MSSDRILAFVFGVVFLAVILIIAIVIPNPSEFQIFVFRIVLAIAAAGIGAVVPGFISVNIPKYIRAGGAIALFVLIYLYNPPALITDFTPFEESILRAEAALAADNHTAAFTFFEKANQAKPKSWIPYGGLARVDYRRGNFTTSLQYFQKAFELMGKKDGSIAYNIAMTQEALGQYEQAGRTLSLAEELMPNNLQLTLDVVYDLGIINLILWLNSDAPKDTQQYGDAMLKFQNFLERRGFPSHWALYHLACLNSRRSEDVSLSAEEVQRLRTLANDQLGRSVREIAEYASNKAPKQRDMMRNLLLAPNEFSRKSGDPVVCPSIIRSWTKIHGSINDLVTRFPLN